MSFTTKSPDISNLPAYLEDLEQRIYEAFRTGEFESINLQQLSVALDKNRSGDVIHADGTNYNPGEGAGIYYFNGTIFTKLG